MPIALPGPGELEWGRERARAASPDPGRAVGNPIDCRVCVLQPVPGGTGEGEGTGEEQVKIRRNVA